MYKTKYILILSLFISLYACDNLDLSNEQASTFKKVLGSGNSEIGKDVIEYDGGFIILATCNHNDGTKDIILYKTDRYGNQKGSVDTLAQNRRGGINTASKLINTNDGGFVVLGTVEDTTDHINNNNHTNIYISKFISATESEWEKFIGTSGNEQGAAIKKAYSGYIIAGCTDINDDKDIYLVKVDDNGNEEWSQIWEGERDAYSGDVLTIDNGYFVVGTVTTENDGTDILYAKTNLTGTPSDAPPYGGNQNDYGKTAVKTDDGGYIIVGNIEEQAGDNYNINIRKVDEGLRNEIWDNDLGGTGLNDEAYKIIKSNDGYTIVGTLESDGGPAAFFIKIAGGTGENIIDEITYGGFGQTIYSIAPTYDGGYIMAGSSGTEGNEMIYLLKVNSDGEL